jgi:hypothetical protein
MRSLVLGLVLAGAAGCVAHAPLSDQYRGPEELPIAIVDRFDPPDPILPRGAASVVLERTKPRLGFTVRRVTLPSNIQQGNRIEFEYYDVDGAQRTPVVIVLPIFNGQPIVTRYFARYFASQGWAALAVDRAGDPLDDMGRPNEALRENLLEYRRVLDWVAEQPELDSDHIGMFGISFGAMDAVMVTALDPRVDALVAAMAGGDLTYLLMNTNYRPVSRTVNGMMEASGLSREDLKETLDSTFTMDPLTLSRYVDAERVLMIMTRRDAIVPFEAQEELLSSMGSPEALYLPTGHRTSIVYFPKVRSSAREFFARHFADSTAN